MNQRKRNKSRGRISSGRGPVRTALEPVLVPWEPDSIQEPPKSDALPDPEPPAIDLPDANQVWQAALASQGHANDFICLDSVAFADGRCAVD